MTKNNRENDYLDKFDEVDRNVRQRLDREFGQLRVIAIAGVGLVVLIVLGRWIFGF